MTHKDYLAAAAKAAVEQLADNAALHVPLDPDVADHMGAFREDALDFAATPKFSSKNKKLPTAILIIY